MSETPAFADFLRRIRAGDARAAAELVQQYEPAIRLAVRTRLTDPALERRLDSVDVCQSVWAGFLLRAAVAGRRNQRQTLDLDRITAALGLKRDGERDDDA
jgi:RNA polymerase sigma-70 factor (ECF subfamily)